MAVYIPKLLMRLSRLLERYALSNPTIKRILGRAIERTGQISVRFPNLWEDAVTMAAQSAMQLLSRMNDSAIASLRYVAVGTESATDMAKPIAAHVAGMLRAAGFPIPRTIATFQTQHACAGGTYSLMGVNALLALGSRVEERGLVICTDVARYDAGTSAEITQGAGAVAMIAERSCGLAELDLATAGYASRDVDDFFRPVGAATPRVRGAFSVNCYKETIEDAFLDHCRRTLRTPAAALQQTDLFAFHAPYHQLPLEMMSALVTKYLGLSGSDLQHFLAQRDFDASIAPAAIVGNLYSGSVFLGLASLLNRRCQRRGEGMVGERLLLLSYGSGNTAVALSGRVAQRAPEIIRRWDIDSALNRAQDARPDDYDRWVAGDPAGAGYATLSGDAVGGIPRDSFYLERIREDGYRVYALHR
jgi:hydroxymethylglutaryl-CoA synthase